MQYGLEGRIVRAGYSGTPLAKKLGIKSGYGVSLIAAPGGFEQILDGLPPAVELARSDSPRGRIVTVAFFTESGALAGSIRQFAAETPANGSLWIAWPKRSSGVSTDITEDVIRDAALPMGLVDNKVCAIDETWSGLRLVVRKENREKWPAASG
jgi:hypothetical protein